jgi:hypothetical protein
LGVGGDSSQAGELVKKMPPALNGCIFVCTNKC